MNIASNPLHISIDAHWDDPAKVWSASSKDIFGLFVEAKSIDQLLGELARVFEDLQPADDSLPDAINFQIECHKKTDSFTHCTLGVEHDLRKVAT